VLLQLAAADFLLTVTLLKYLLLQLTGGQHTAVSVTAAAFAAVVAAVVGHRHGC
jgi:hypothetical protein